MEDQDAFLAVFEPVDVRTIHVDVVYTHILMVLLYFKCVYVQDVCTAGSVILE